MRKKTSLGIIILVIFLVIAVIVLGFLYYRSKAVPLNNDITNNEDSTPKEDLNLEKDNLSKELEDLTSSLGFILIYANVENYNKNGEYQLSSNTDLFTEDRKKLFVMEQILMNQDNYSNFILLDQ